MNSIIIGAALLALSVTSVATLVDNGFYTTDTETRLDLSVTQNVAYHIDQILSYGLHNDVNHNMVAMGVARSPLWTDYDPQGRTVVFGTAYVDGGILELNTTSANTYFGTSLVKSSAVPIPAAAWLFGSGLIGLVGIRKFNKDV